MVYCGPPSSEAAALFANDLKTRLLVVQGYDTAAREWCAARGVELVSEAPAAAAARCRGALEATLWSAVAPPEPAAARVSRELSDHLVNAGDTSTAAAAAARGLRRRRLRGGRRRRARDLRRERVPTTPAGSAPPTSRRSCSTRSALGTSRIAMT